jgi:hypothetical protein
MLNEDDPGFAEELKRRVAAFEAGESPATEWNVVRDRIREQLVEARKQRWLDEIAAEQTKIANGEAVKLDRRESVEQARAAIEEHRRRKS